MQNTVTKTYSVFFDGKLREGFSRVKVAVALKEKLKFTDPQLKKFFKGRVKLKQNADKESVMKLRQMFYEVGVELSIEPDNIAQSQKISSPPIRNQNKFDFTVLKNVFSTPIKKIELSTSYKLALLTVGLLTVLIPVFYISLIIGTAVGLYWYVNNIYPYLSNLRGLSLILAYALPTFSGLVFILFMIKPLFAQYAHAPVKVLDERKHKQFFDLVYLLCAHIGVPKPVKIIVDNEINASASLHRGVLGIFKRELILTVGMPLIAGMSARQLVGVLAHEFGHFAQSMGMSVYYLINTVNYWLYSRAYEQDSWDDRLANWQNKTDIGVLNLSIFAAQICIRLTRHLMGGLFHISTLMSRHMSRQMEFDADRYESRVAGSSHFKSTALKLYELVYARKIVDEMNTNAWNENMLLDNIPKAIAAQVKQIDEKTLKSLEEKLSEIQTNTWDSHPADHARIDNVIIQKDPGLFLFDEPASILMPEFESLCHYVTAKEYASAGIESPANHMVADTKIANMFGDSKRANTSLELYFNGIFNQQRFLNSSAKLLEKDTNLSLQDTIDKLRHQMPAYRDAARNYFENIKRRNSLKLAYEYVRVNVSIDPSEFYTSQADLSTINTDIGRIEDLLHKNEEVLNVMDSLFTRRIALCIANLQGDRLEHCNTAINTIREFGKYNSDINNLNRLIFILRSMTAERNSELVKKLKPVIEKNTKECQDAANQLLYRMREVKYFDNETKSRRGMDDFIKSWFRTNFNNFSSLEVSHCVHYSDSMIHAIRYQYTRILGDLVSRCLVIEKELNLQPLRLLP